MPDPAKTVLNQRHRKYQQRNLRHKLKAPTTPLQILRDQVAENRNRWLVLWCFVALTGLVLYNFFPAHLDSSGNYIRYHFFPFHSQALTPQTYVDYLGSRFSISTLLWALFLYSPQYREQLFIFWLLSVGYIVDYLLIYNDPFLHVLGVPLSYTYFMLTLSGWITYKTFSDE